MVCWAQDVYKRQVYLQMFQLQTEDGWDELAEVLANDPRVTIR